MRGGVSGGEGGSRRRSHNKAGLPTNAHALIDAGQEISRSKLAAFCPEPISGLITGTYNSIPFTL